FILLHRYRNRVQTQPYRPLDQGQPQQPDQPEESTSQAFQAAGTSSQPSSSSAAAAARHHRSNPDLTEVEDLYLTLSRPATDDFNDRCHDHGQSCCSVRKVCGDRLRRYKQNIETAIEAVEMTPSPFHDESLSNDFHQLYQHMYL